MPDFKIHSPYSPTGDQPQAIEQLASSFAQGVKSQTLLGVTGSGKTFTMANVIEKLQRPTLILSHNKTLAAQLYSEFKGFFPENAVEYFVSYYDYYQPEAYIPTTDTYIEKDLSINDEIEKLRLSAATSLLSGRRDVIVVSSVSCLYGIGNPEDFHNSTIYLKRGDVPGRSKVLYSLVDALYNRTEGEFKRGSFRVKGDCVDIYLAYGDLAARVVFFGDEIESIELIDPVSGATAEYLDEVSIYPATNFLTTRERLQDAIRNIQDDMMARYEYFMEVGRRHEANRLKQRVEYDLEMIREIGWCSGIENYSRYFDHRESGQRPFCLLDYFPDDFLTFIDESHVTIPQIHAMYGGDHSRKNALVEYGFRLPAAFDNRPLKFAEFDSLVGQRLYVSATPGDYELQECQGIVAEQVVRPTGLLDPPIEVRPTKNQIDDLMNEIDIRASHDERVLVTTLTKRSAEDVEQHFTRHEIRCRYIHSDVDTLERIEILDDLKAGRIDVLVGVNLLREGLDIPAVSLVAILDADKEGFLRSQTALTQMAGRAARNIGGQVIMYADRVTDSMQRTIDETARRRAKQESYNVEHGITPHQVGASGGSFARAEDYLQIETQDRVKAIASDPVLVKMPRNELESMISAAKKNMEEAAAALEFMKAAQYRDEM
ncbi:MAG: excinuclease ABC subunit UvrB, partial [Bacteroidales bacterium]|nr:excinuclease ABC subunit UvrB [Bacteroidales bacterium]